MPQNLILICCDNFYHPSTLDKSWASPQSPIIIHLVWIDSELGHQKALLSQLKCVFRSLSEICILWSLSSLLCVCKPISCSSCATAAATCSLFCVARSFLLLRLLPMAVSYSQPLAWTSSLACCTVRDVRLIRWWLSELSSGLGRNQKR